MYQFRSFLRSVGTTRKSSTSKGANETFKLLEEHSSGITWLAGFTVVVGGIVGFIVHWREERKHKIMIAKKDIERANILAEMDLDLAKIEGELKALKNSLLIGKSKSSSSREIEERPTDKAE
mmetsp:Transcript_14851/g.22344  ORF Transcript_14851/g.22344 Transcript_14851/m.22344 type:complete len:122 (-) Transcript_14851:235-600(-)